MHHFEWCESTKRQLRGLCEELPGAWNSFGHKNEEYATTNETDFMGCITMPPAFSRLLIIPSQTVFDKNFAKPLAKRFRKISNV